MSSVAAHGHRAARDARESFDHTCTTQSMEAGAQCSICVYDVSNVLWVQVLSAPCGSPFNPSGIVNIPDNR